MTTRTNSDDIDEILKKFDNDNYTFWADNTDKTLTLQQWNKGKAKIRKEAKAAISKQIVEAELKWRIDLDKQVPNFWKTGQKEYTHQDMQKLLDYNLKRIEQLRSNDNE